MSYNVLNYGFPASGNCPALITANKHAWLRTVIEYTMPDILGLEKMDATPATFTSDTIVARVLDSVCPGCYGHTPYTNNSGYEKENMLYFNNAKFGWLSTKTIYSADSTISDINLHTLFYKNAALLASHDTIFLHIILVHLASGSGSAAERGAEMAGAMAWLNAHITAPGNYIFMGDFNTQSSSESCFQDMNHSTDSNTLFFDVANQPGNWDSDPDNFARYLTQSTRTSDPGDCGATGGMDDWFDHLLCTNPIMQGTGKVNYLSGSFSVIGQDGQHVNKSLIANPANTSVPGNVLSALYYMSEHLPVIMQLAIDTASATTGITGPGNGPLVQWHYNSPVANQLCLIAAGATEVYEAAVYDITGRMLSKQPLNNTGENILPVSNLADGVYILVVTQQEQVVTTGKFVKFSH